MSREVRALPQPFGRGPYDFFFLTLGAKASGQGGLWRRVGVASRGAWLGEWRMVLQVVLAV